MAKWRVNIFSFGCQPPQVAMEVYLCWAASSVCLWQLNFPREVFHHTYSLRTVKYVWLLYTRNNTTSFLPSPQKPSTLREGSITTGPPNFRAMGMQMAATGLDWELHNRLLPCTFPFFGVQCKIKWLHVVTDSYEIATNCFPSVGPSIAKPCDPSRRRTCGPSHRHLHSKTHFFHGTIPSLQGCSFLL